MIHVLLKWSLFRREVNFWGVCSVTILEIKEMSSSFDLLPFTASRFRSANQPEFSQQKPLKVWLYWSPVPLRSGGTKPWNDHHWSVQPYCRSGKKRSNKDMTKYEKRRGCFLKDDDRVVWRMLFFSSSLSRLNCLMLGFGMGWHGILFSVSQGKVQFSWMEDFPRLQPRLSTCDNDSFR